MFEDIETKVYVEKFCICGAELSTEEEKELDMCEDCLGNTAEDGDPRPLDFSD